MDGEDGLSVTPEPDVEDVALLVVTTRLSRPRAKTVTADEREPVSVQGAARARDDPCCVGLAENDVRLPIGF